MKAQIVKNTQVKIDRLVPGGQGIGTLEDGKKAFFWNALPGETVLSFQITKNKASYLEGIALELAAPLSPHRVAPRDDCYLATSPWQIVDFPYELTAKAALVEECFRQQHLPAPEIKPAITDGHEYFYRNKMEYSLYWDNTFQEINLAFHARGSHRKLPITQSSLERPEIFAKATEIVTELNAQHAAARDYQSLMLRASQDGTVSGGLFVKHQPHPSFPALSDRLAGHNYLYSPNGFFQINLPVYELTLAAIAPHITTDKVLDLYAGVGTIGLSVAADHQLTLVECNKAAYTELVKNCSGTSGLGDVIRRDHSEPTGENERGAPATAGGDDACPENSVAKSATPTPILAKSEDALEYITPDTTVILDPPRAGCDPKLIEKLNTEKPPKIIYLSCNPITQARDIAALAPNYQITDISTFNFFPHTPHIENLVILARL